MIHRVRCVARCEYTGPAEAAAAVLRLRPRAPPHGRVRACTSRVEPRAAVLRQGTDHFGNPVAWLRIDRPHAGFEAVSEAVVEVSAPVAPDPFVTPAWEAVARAGALAHEAAEFAFDSPLAPASEAARAYAAPSFPPGFPVLAGLLDLLGRVGRDARIERGIAGAADAAGTADAGARAVGAAACQDLVHAMIAGLRGLGLPARHVSGCARRGGGGARGVHAWAECWLGPRHGWLGLDPAEDRVVGDEYVPFGRGRDGADVAPVRVVPTGVGVHALAVDVAFDSGA